MDNLQNIVPNKPLYVYQCPMFLLTVSTAVIVDNGIVLIEEGNCVKMPGGVVRSAQETIQFAAVRYVKEQTGILLKKDALIPVDFRSDPERSEEGNIIDIGFVCIPEKVDPDIIQNAHPYAKWEAVDFETKKLIDFGKKKRFYMDHKILLERALDVVMMIR